MLLALVVAAEEQPRLVHDVQGITAHGSLPRIWTSSGTTTWFTASTARSTREIFRTDGTRAGTVQLTFGKGSPYPHHDQSYNSGAFVGVVNGKLVYGGSDPYGGGLYALDMNGGTPVLLEDLTSHHLENGVVLDGWLYFNARSWGRGEYRMWRTDGTPEGTQELDVLLDYSEARLYLAGDRIFFFGRTELGSGLHVTRGTRATTTLLHPFDAWSMGWYLVPFHVRTVGDRLVFWMSPSRSELWGTDGTPEGTKVLGDFHTYGPLRILGGRLFFQGPENLVWSTDGTPEGTRETGLVPAFDNSIQGGTVLGAELFFYVDRNNVMTLYGSGGTPETTRALMSGTRNTLPARGLVAGGVYYFVYDDGVHGAELWRTDGVTAPRMVTDLNPGKASGIGYELVAVARSDGSVLLAGTHRDSSTEPWITDGTAEGTRLLINVAAEDFTSYSGSPEHLQASGHRVFFTASTNDGAVIGVSDGLRTTTMPAGGSSVATAVASRGRYFFSTDAGFFATDGTSTTHLEDFRAALHRVPGGVVFGRHVPKGGISLGYEILFSDGTLSGTRVIRGLTPEPSHYWMQAAGDRVWLADGKRFFVTDGASPPVEITPAEPVAGYLRDAIRAGTLDYLVETRSSSPEVRVWRSDGTSAGTRVLVARSGGTGQHGYFVGATERHVYFVINREIFVSDGTPEGTITLPAPPPPCKSQGVLGETLLFGDGRSLWRTDGTAAGTTKLMTFPRDHCPELVAHGGRVYFDGEDAEHGQELWQSDGTVDGTRLVADIVPGTGSSWPGRFTAAGDRLFFTATTEIGRELWILGGPEVVKRRAIRR